MIGTLVNTGAVVAASAVGLLIHKRMPQKTVDIVFQALGLVTIGIGISMALEMQNMLLAVVSLVVGAVIGQWIGIDRRLERFSGWLQTRGRKPKTGSAPGDQTAASGRFTEGFITATMIFCIGSMSILGAMEDGMGETPKLLYTKSIMDATTSIVLASTFGIGVMFSAISVLVYQGGLTLLTAFLVRYMSDVMIADMTGVGGLLIIGLGINLLKIREINVINLLPSLVVILLLSYFFG